MAIAKAYLDTSALFAGLWSPEGGARRILELGEADIVTPLISSQVLQEIESVLRRKAPSALGLLAIILDRSGVTQAPDPSREELHRAQSMTGHAGDSQVLAAALAAQPDFLVTLDRERFLDNQAVRAGVLFHVGTPGDCLVWLRLRLAG